MITNFIFGGYIVRLQHVTWDSSMTFVRSFLHDEIREKLAQCWSLVDTNRNTEGIWHSICSSNTGSGIIVKCHYESHRFLMDYLLPHGKSVKGFFKIYEGVISNKSWFFILNCRCWIRFESFKTFRKCTQKFWIKS